MAKDTRDKIAIIGAGHMGSALQKGFLSSGISRARIIVSDSARNNVHVAKKADIIFLTVKPAIVKSVLAQIQTVSEGKLIVSAVAGVRVRAMQRIADHTSVARIMPNIPVAHNEGVVGLYAPGLSSRNKKKLGNLLKRLGLLVEVKNENALDALTLLAGCGPGIVAALVSAYTKQAQRFGIKGGEKLSRQVFTGALQHLTHSKITSQELAEAVATKGGVTEAILQELARGGLEKILTRAFAKGRAKIQAIR